MPSPPPNSSASPPPPSLKSPPSPAPKQNSSPSSIRCSATKATSCSSTCATPSKTSTRSNSPLAQTELHDFLTPTYSYLSVVELGLYESTAKTYSALAARDIVPHSPEWNAGIQETLARQAAAMATRIYPTIPDAPYACFYPMDRKRGEEVNWYTETMADRQRMMHLHGMIGRRYADDVRQIISGSIGLDDWEWGVDLFAQDPVTFKRLIYEMRFDEVSARYALFGSFYVLLSVPLASLVVTIVDVVVRGVDPSEVDVPAVLFPAKDPEPG